MSIVIVVEEGKLVMEKAEEKKKNIKELFEGYNEDYTPEEIEWGNAEGKEI